MNDFLEQFVLESRELVEQATASLGALEQTPSEIEQIDALFRAFHTLKGGASIVEFAAMERAVHATESALTPLRSGGASISKALIGACFACLDHVSRWLDHIERTGGVPDAHQEATALSATVAEAVGQPTSKVPVSTHGQRPEWLEELLRRQDELAKQAKTAVRYVPHADSFLRGEDPLASIAALPELLAIDLEPIGVWPELDSLDPFQSVLAITALSGAPIGDLKKVFGESQEEVEFVELAGTDDSSADLARRILEEQVALLSEDFSAGRIVSAGTVAANVLRRTGRTSAAESIEKAIAQSVSDGAAAPLQDRIRESLAVKPASSLAPTEASPEGGSRTLRVNADRIDALVRLAGELSVIKNAIGHAAKLAATETSELAIVLKNNHGALDRMTAELQRSVLSMRVLPLRTVMHRFTRVVREMSSALGKPVRVLLEGGDTEADKAVVEMLFEPLMHVVRNAMDHGIEDARARAASGKPAEATIVMRALRAGEHVVIEIQDDGAGVDVDRVRTVAIDKGVVSTETAHAMSNADVVDLIFTPGFSTARAVTELSGRGVGMDAVRSAVARMGGRVSIESEHGVGTTVRFALPFSVLMTHVMTVESGGQMFGIPLEAIVETVSVPASSITGVGAGRAIVRRDRTVPVFDLASLLNVPSDPRNKSDSVIVIASFAGQVGGIEVDRLGERMEVMLKPLEGMLSGIPGVAGTTILGDGRVLLVLDLEGVLQ